MLAWMPVGSRWAEEVAVLCFEASLLLKAPSTLVQITSLTKTTTMLMLHRRLPGKMVPMHGRLAVSRISYRGVQANSLLEIVNSRVMRKAWDFA